MLEQINAQTGREERGKWVQDERKVPIFLSGCSGTGDPAKGEAEEVVIVVQAHLIEINAQFNGDKHKSSYSVRAAGERVSLGVIQCRIMDVVQSIGADREEGRCDVCFLWCTSPYRQSLIQPIFLHIPALHIMCYYPVCLLESLC